MALANVIEFQENIQNNDLTTQVKQILVALNGAFKKILLYPPEHVIYKDSLKTLKNNLDKYFIQNGYLELKIDRNKILYMDEVVHEGPTSEENLAFILFRDGIHYLALKNNIKDWEIHIFLEILKNHQILTEDAENDTVTALWEMELPSLHYEADDVGFDIGEEFEIPELGCVEPSNDLLDPQSEQSDGIAGESPLHIPAFNRALWELTQKDHKHLKELLVEEEDWERIEYVIYILLYVLQQQEQPENFSEVMAYLNQELQDAMKENKYKSVYNTLNMLRTNLDSPKIKGHWAEPILEDFFISLSGKSFLNVMQDTWEGIESCGQPELLYLKKTLLLLNANAIDAICPMLLKVRSNQTKKLLMEVIGSLAKNDFKYLGKQLSSTNTELVSALVSILGFMKSEASFAGLLKMMRHPSANVRKKALKAASHRKPAMIWDWFYLLEDPDEGVQQFYLKCAGNKRDVKIEKLLRDYLKKKRIRSGNRNRILQIFRTLGRCGSDRSLPFLRNNIFILSFLGIMRSKKSPRRQAAYYALKELKTETAEILLKKLS